MALPGRSRKATWVESRRIPEASYTAGDGRSTVSAGDSSAGAGRRAVESSNPTLNALGPAHREAWRAGRNRRCAAAASEIPNEMSAQSGIGTLVGVPPFPVPPPPVPDPDVIENICMTTGAAA